MTLAAMALFMSPIIAEELDPASKFTDDEKAAFKEARAKIANGKQAIWAEFFRYQDKDADGLLTLEEAKAHEAKKAQKHKHEPKDMEPIFKEWDANSDGIVTIVEFKTAGFAWMKEQIKAHRAKNKAEKEKKKTEEKN